MPTQRCSNNELELFKIDSKLPKNFRDSSRLRAFVAKSTIKLLLSQNQKTL